MKIRKHIYHSPCGDLLLISMDGKLATCDWILPDKPTCVIYHDLARETEERPDDTLKLAIARLNEYFAGRRKVFDVPLTYGFSTGFHAEVLDVLQEIPYGETWSYKQEAERLGRPRASRAVGAMNRRNQLSIFIPCHRVVGADGRLTGYGGGLEAKQYLLQLENPRLKISNGKILNL